MPSEQPIVVTLESAAALSLRYSFANVSNQVVQLFVSRLFPYLILQERTLRLLFGVHPHDPDVEYPIVEIPLSEPFAPGDRREGTVSLSPLMLHNHYLEDRRPTILHGAIDVLMEVGWGRTPILAEDRFRHSVSSLLEWQQLARSPTLVVEFP